jgi:hypothetical protein
MSITKRVKIREVSNNTLRYEDKEFIIDELHGRLHGLQVNRGDGEYDLFIFYKDILNKGEFRYESIVLQYFKSTKHDKILFVAEHKHVASDNYFSKLDTGELVSRQEALDENGNLKPGYVTEALRLEAFLGDPVADAIEAAARRKYNLPN